MNKILDSNTHSILFLSPYPPGTAPSQRFRFEWFINDLKIKGHQIQHKSFYSPENYASLYQPSSALSTFLMILRNILDSLKLIPVIKECDIVFLHREFWPVGPPIFEFIIARILKKPIIYDFDDAIWLNDPNELPGFKTRAKWKSKIPYILKWSKKVSAGNEYLARYASSLNNDVHIIPTVVNTDVFHPSTTPREGNNEKITIGWTGSHSTNYYLKQIESVLKEIEDHFPVQFLFISNQAPHLDLKHQSFIPWKQETEVEDLSKIDIGIMPLTDDAWSRGKCGFKLIQYMSLGIPAIASPVGVNQKIIHHEHSGYLAETEHDWYQYLKILIVDKSIRQSMGAAGQAVIQQHYSTDSVKSDFLDLFVL